MRKSLFLLLFLVMYTWSSAQPVQASVISARTNVAAYDDENDILKLAYQASPYYMELDESWEQKRTDSSF